MRKKIQDITTKEILTTREAAQLLKVTPQTIKNYIYSGKLKALQTPGGHHRIKKADLKSLGFLDSEEKDPREHSTADGLWSAYNSLMKDFTAVIEAFTKALDSRDILSSGHSSRVAGFALTVGEKLGLSENGLRELRLAALLHDVGKVGISETILGKPGRLTEQEYSQIQRHPEIGEQIAGEAIGLQEIAPIIRHCHERYDGNGYPDKVSGSDIELCARIIAVADTYDFLRSELPFSRKMSEQEALAEIKSLAGKQFDPKVVEVFSECVERGHFRYN